MVNAPFTSPDRQHADGVVSGRPDTKKYRSVNQLLGMRRFRGSAKAPLSPPARFRDIEAEGRNLSEDRNGQAESAA
jgi:hypothetical protein